MVKLWLIFEGVCASNVAVLELHATSVRVVRIWEWLRCRSEALGFAITRALDVVEPLSRGIERLLRRPKAWPRSIVEISCFCLRNWVCLGHVFGVCSVETSIARVRRPLMREVVEEQSRLVQNGIVSCLSLLVRMWKHSSVSTADIEVELVPLGLQLLSEHVLLLLGHSVTLLSHVGLLNLLLLDLLLALLG